MGIVSRERLIPHMDAYKLYLEGQNRAADCRPLSNLEEDYKRKIAEKAMTTLDSQSWSEAEIGRGLIGDLTIKAVQQNLNLVGRFQVSAFANKVKENYPVSEQILFDLYHDHKDRESFEKICGIFGRKYDLVAYLYFIADPRSYLPLRSSIFDGIFKNLDINLQTTGRCSWENYQEFLGVVAEVKNIMAEYFGESDIDLLDAHSFLWTLNLGVLKEENKKNDAEAEHQKEKTVEEGATVFHKDYGDGIISKLTAKNVYVRFGEKHRIFPYPEAFEKEYLTL